MLTSSFFTYTGPGRISIARYPPRGTPAGFRIYPDLAPGPWFKSVSRPVYEQLYGAQLANLDPHQVVLDLQDLAGAARPVLLCWEKPPFNATNFCHRRMVAAWLEQHLGIAVDEIA